MENSTTKYRNAKQLVSAFSRQEVPSPSTITDATNRNKVIASMTDSSESKARTDNRKAGTTLNALPEFASWNLKFWERGLGKRFWEKIPGTRFRVGVDRRSDS